MRDPTFQATLNRRRKEMSDAVDLRLRSIAYRAAETVATAVEDGNLRASLQVLRGVGLLTGERHKIGSDDPNVLREEAAIQERAEASDRGLRDLIAGI